MTLGELLKQAELEVKAGDEQLDTEVTGGYSGDLISMVLANGKEGNVWVTWLCHPNIVAAAVVVKLAAIIIVDGREPDEQTIQKANEEGIAILVTKLPAFEIIGRFHDIGITGT